MRRIFLFFLLSFLSLNASYARAQLLDDLFAEEELEDTSNIEAMQKKATEQGGIPTTLDILPPSLDLTPLVTPSKQPLAPQQSVSAPPVRQQSVQAPQTPVQAPAQSQPIVPQTLSLSRSKPQMIQAATPSLPSLGSGRTALPSLGTSPPEKSLSLFEMRAKKTGSSNTNVSQFDIAGLRLKMTPQEVLEISEKAGFSVKIKEEEVPQLNEWKYNRICLDYEVFKYQEKKECIEELAKNNNLSYINRLVLENKKLKEEINIDFASHFTKNQAYYIKYINKGDHSLGATNHAHYINSKRRNEFLSLLIKKYGAPDDEQKLLWGVYGVGATLKADLTDTALDVLLVLQDASIPAQDFDNMSIADAKENTNKNFSF